MRAAERAGFTLIEVLVALVLSAIVVLGARGLLDGMLGQTGSVVRSAHAADSLASIDLTLHRVVSNLALARGDTVSFDGDERAARFESWCLTAGGWQERCAVHLLANPDAPDGVRLVVPMSAPMVFGAGNRSALRYLADVGGGGQWVKRWQTSITPPLAIGVLTGTDTMVLRIGALR